MATKQKNQLYIQVFSNEMCGINNSEEIKSKLTCYWWKTIMKVRFTRN